MKFKPVKIKMLKRAVGQDVDVNGVSKPVQAYDEGKEYVVAPAFAKALVDGKYAEVVVPAAPAAAPVAPPVENKDAGALKAPVAKKAK